MPNQRSWASTHVLVLSFQTKTPRDIDPRAVNMRREITRVICLGDIAIDIVQSRCWLRLSLGVFVIRVLSSLQLTLSLLPCRRHPAARSRAFRVGKYNPGLDEVNKNIGFLARNMMEFTGRCFRKTKPGGPSDERRDWVCELARGTDGFILSHPPATGPPLPRR
jgi:hypothetical protein